MSRILARFPTRPKKLRVLPKYNWELWLDGRVHALHADEYVDAYRFRNSAWQIARRKGIDIRTAIIAGELIIQAQALERTG